MVPPEGSRGFAGGSPAAFGRFAAVVVEVVAADGVTLAEGGVAEVAGVGSCSFGGDVEAFALVLETTHGSAGKDGLGVVGMIPIAVANGRARGRDRREFAYRRAISDAMVCSSRLSHSKRYTPSTTGF